jgi:hypothetical protein
MKPDFFGQELQVGDIVAATEPNYHNLVSCKVVKFTPKGIKVENLEPVPCYKSKEWFVHNTQVIKKPT